MDNILTWNVRNWVTVFLMFALAWAIIAGGAHLFIGRTKKTADNA